MKVSITIDLEQDCPPYFHTFRGMEEGMPPLLSLLRSEEIPATFFCTGAVARKFPDVIHQIVSDQHELGCHGDSHKKFTDMSWEEAKQEIADSTNTLKEFYPVKSFRAPNLVFPSEYLSLLEDAGYQVDSSIAKYKRGFQKGLRFPTKLTRIPASITSSVLRVPKFIRYPWFRQLGQPVVLFVHPWEFVDFTKTNLRLDCRFRTGEPALNALQENIRFFKGRGATFIRMQDLAGLPSGSSP